VVDQTSVIATHLAEIVRQNAQDLLTRQETKRLLDALAGTHPKLVEELIPRLLTMGELQKVLQQLLREQVSIRDLPAILETLVDTAPANKNPVHLVESVRQALGRSLVTPLLGADRKLKVITLDPGIEDELSRSIETPAAGERSALPSVPLMRRVLDGLQKLVGDPAAIASTILLCNSRRASICAVFLNRFCRAWWFFPRRKFHRAFPSSLSGWSDESPRHANTGVPGRTGSGGARAFAARAFATSPVHRPANS